MKRLNDLAWKNFQNSKIELKSQNDKIYDLYVDYDLLEDSIMGYLYQNLKIPKEMLDELTEIENELNNLNAQNNSEQELKDIQLILSHIKKLRELL